MGNYAHKDGGNPGSIKDMFTIENSIGVCYYNTVFLVFFTIDIFNNTVRNYVYTFIDPTLLNLIENGENPYKDNFIYKFKYKYYEFIILGYFIMYTHAISDGNVKDCYVNPLIVYIKALGCKYFPDEFLLDAFDDTFDPMMIDELNDNFSDYDFTPSYKDDGGRSMDVIKVLLNLFSVVATNLPHNKKRRFFIKISNLFTVNEKMVRELNMVDAVEVSTYTMNPILILMAHVKEGLGFSPFICTKDDDTYDDIIHYVNKNYLTITKINEDETISNISIGKNVNKFPIKITIGKHLYSLVAKSLYTVLGNKKDKHHNEIIIKSMKTNTFYRVSNDDVIKCDDPWDDRTIPNEGNENYDGTCKHHNCFDRYVDYAIYLRVG